VAAIESERAQAMVEWCRPTTGNRGLPLGMADLNVAGRRIDSDLDRRGQLPQAEIAQSNVGYYAGPRKRAFWASLYKSRPSGRLGDEAATFFRNAR
jgi:hypothetical protein